MVAFSLRNCGNEKKNLTINRRIFREKEECKKKKKKNTWPPLVEVKNLEEIEGEKNFYIEELIRKNKE